MTSPFQQVEPADLAVRVFCQQQDAQRGSHDVRRAESAFGLTAPASFQKCQHQDRGQREGHRADKGKGVRAVGAMIMQMKSEPQGQGEGDRHARRGDLRQCYAHEHQPAHHEKHPDERASEADEHAGINRVAQEKIGRENLA